METNKCKTTTKACRQSDVVERSGSTDYFAAVLSRAERTVEQWDNHDQYRQTEADKSLNDPQLGEPDDVAIARTVLRLNDAMESAELHFLCIRFGRRGDYLGQNL